MSSGCVGGCREVRDGGGGGGTVRGRGVKRNKYLRSETVGIQLKKHFCALKYIRN